MEVALVSSVDPAITKPGGTRSYVLNLVKGLAKEDIDITLFGIHGGPPPKRVRFVSVLKAKKGRSVTSQEFLFRLFLKAPFVKLPNGAIIHAQRPDHMVPFILFKRKNPKVCTIHGAPDVGIRRRKGRLTSRIYEGLERFSLKRVDKIIFVDAVSRQAYIKKYGWLRDRTSLIPVGVDLDKFRPMDKALTRNRHGFSAREKIILYIGRIEVEKRLDLLIEAFKRFPKEMKAILLVVGEGTLTKRLRMSGNMNITFMGTIPHEKMPQIINCADVLALSSEYEGLPMVILEALACGIPVVSTDVGDVHNVVVDGKTGYLAQGTVEDIKDKLMMILQSDYSFEKSCIDMARRYSNEDVVNKIIGVYHEVTKEC